MGQVHIVYLDALGVLAEQLYKLSLFIRKAVGGKICVAHAHAHIAERIPESGAADPRFLGERALCYGLPVCLSVDYRAAAQHHDRRGQRAFAALALFHEHV